MPSISLKYIIDRHLQNRLMYFLSMIHENIDIRWCTNYSHGTSFYLQIVFTVQHTKLFSAYFKAENVPVTLVATAFLGKLLGGPFTAFIPSELGIMI